MSSVCPYDDGQSVGGTPNEAHVGPPVPPLRMQSKRASSAPVESEQIVELEKLGALEGVNPMSVGAHDI